MTITLTVSGRIASVDATAHVVAGNTYPVALSLDSEWTGSLYLRVRFGSLYYDIPFASSAASVDVQMPVGYPEVGIGVFSEALEICSCEARIRLLRSILEAGEQVVEFDSDLYDQWAGEVTTLLTDDAFDAESTRPVQNAVLTAWKDTVPLDSALVHKTGNESVDGTKTFNAGLFAGGTTPLLHLRSTGASTSSAWKGVIRISDKNGSADSDIVEARIVSGGTSSSNSLEVYGAKPDRSSKMLLLNGRAYADHCALLTTPYYPVDGSSNPQALTANALVTSGNVAVDPRLVHTSGVETIAGAKTFTSKAEIRSSEYATINLKSMIAYSTGGSKSGIFLTGQGPNGNDVIYGDIGLYQTVSQGVNIINIGGRTLDETTKVSAGLRCANNGASYWFGPSYLPAGSQGEHLAPPNTATINSQMLAVDPRIVHTTGNETVAGVKTLTNGINAYPQGWHGTSKAMTAGQYCVFAHINPANLGPGHFHILDFVQSSNTSCCYGRMMFKADRTGPLPMWMFKKNVGSNNPLDVGSIVVLTDASTVYLAWRKTAPYGTLVSREVMDINYGGPQSLGGASNVQFYAQADMTILDNLDGYTVYEVTE